MVLISSHSALSYSFFPTSLSRIRQSINGSLLFFFIFKKQEGQQLIHLRPHELIAMAADISYYNGINDCRTDPTSPYHI